MTHVPSTGMSMDAREFGNSGLTVSPITLGSWPMSGDRYGAIDDSEAVQTIRRARDQGITSFDTAPGYGTGHAEETLGAALGGLRAGGGHHQMRHRPSRGRPAARQQPRLDAARDRRQPEPPGH